MSARKYAFRWLLALVVSTAAGMANAETYPSHTVKFIVPFTAGGSSDILARVLAQKMSEMWGQPVVVENRSGAGGMIGTEAVARSVPDGYTLLLGGVGSHAINPALYNKKISYDADKDFTPISLLARIPNLLVVNPSQPMKSAKDLIAYAKANPGKVTYSSAGTGTTSHLAGEMFRRQAEIDIVHVPYRGSQQALTDLIAGHVSFTFDYMATALPHVRNGKLRPLAVTGSSRAQAAPEIPTMIEEGLPAFNVVTWYAVYASKGVPADVVSKIHKAIVAAAAAPEVIKRMDDLSVELVAGTPEELDRFQRGELKRWSELIQDANIKAE